MKPSIDIFGITFVEPMTMLTDYLIAMLACWFGVRLLYAQYSKRQLCRRAWGIGFIFIGMGALFGGTYHGFFELLDKTFLTILWKATLYTVGFSVFFMLAGTVKGSIQNLKWRKPFYIYNAISLAAYCLIMIFNNDFIFVILDYVPALILIFALQAWAYFKHKAPSARWLMAGVVISFIGAGVQVSKFALHVHFNHNDLYHTIQLFGLYCFYKGVRQLSDYGRSEVSLKSL